MRAGSLRSVEAYDDVADAWTRMPDMCESRLQHKSVAVRNKLYVVGGFVTWYEVFDSTSNRFTTVIPDNSYYGEVFCNPAEVFAIGGKLVVFSHGVQLAIYFDVESNEWSKVECEIIGQTEYYCGVKLPCF